MALNRDVVLTLREIDVIRFYLNLNFICVINDILKRPEIAILWMK